MNPEDDEIKIYDVKLKCPKCGSEIMRQFTFFESMALILPISFRRSSTFACQSGCCRFNGPRGLGGALLSCVSGVAFLCMESLAIKIVALLGAVFSLLALRFVYGFKRFHSVYATIACTVLWLAVVIEHAVPAPGMVGLSRAEFEIRCWTCVVGGLSLGILTCYIDQRFMRPDQLIMVEALNQNSGDITAERRV